ncbi:MAG TPA: DNA repair protein RecO [Flavipsychrobacter sp.]|nr:DNA repair protein RecO [Flavipsychrobacter sp.]
MLQTTKGIVLRSVKYGDTSLVSTIFTRIYGVQTYMVKGVRTSKAKSNRAGLLQPATLLDMVVYQRPQHNMQHIREFQLAHIYQSLQQEVVKNSIALFSVELLLRLLPEQAPLSDLFDFAFDYFCMLDEMPVEDVANFPLYFVLQCGRLLGYELKGSYTANTPHLDLHEGGFSSQAPVVTPFVNDTDAKALAQLLRINAVSELKAVDMNSTMRYRLLDWYIAFLHQYTQHLGNIKSLAVLQAILH